MEVKYREEQVITSPYVTQADKMAVSLRHLADRFLKMEPKKQCFTPEEDAVSSLYSVLHHILQSYTKDHKKAASVLPSFSPDTLISCCIL